MTHLKKQKRGRSLEEILERAHLRKLQKSVPQELKCVVFNGDIDGEDVG